MGPKPILYPYLQEMVATRFDDQCWVWPGTHTPAGYPMVRDGKVRKVATVAYELRYGQVPFGLELDHLCQNKPCWNPDHLEAVTHMENSFRADYPNRRKTHCINGHPFDKDNTMPGIGRNGRTWRKCKACHRNRARNRREQDNFVYVVDN